MIATLAASEWQFHSVVHAGHRWTFRGERPDPFPGEVPAHLRNQACSVPSLSPSNLRNEDSTMLWAQMHPLMHLLHMMYKIVIVQDSTTLKGRHLKLVGSSVEASIILRSHPLE